MSGGVKSQLRNTFAVPNVGTENRKVRRPRESPKGRAWEFILFLGVAIKFKMADFEYI